MILLTCSFNWIKGLKLKTLFKEMILLPFIVSILMCIHIFLYKITKIPFHVSNFVSIFNFCRICFELKTHNVAGSRFATYCCFVVLWRYVELWQSTSFVEYLYCNIFKESAAMFYQRGPETLKSSYNGFSNYIIKKNL